MTAGPGMVSVPAAEARTAAPDPAFSRLPLSEEGGIPVFLSPSAVRAFDEYAQGNPYRNEYMQQSRWDVFRRSRITAGAAGPQILDAGCGEGDLTGQLCARGQVHAIDISISAVRLAQPRFPNVSFAVASALDLPFRDHYFDSVVAANLFEHVESPVSLLRECHRVLRSGGRLVLSTPSRYRTANFRRVLRGRPVRFNHVNHITEYTTGQVLELLRWAGFRDVIIQSNIRCHTLLGTCAAALMQGAARALKSHVQFGDPTIYIATKP